MYACTRFNVLSLSVIACFLSACATDIKLDPRESNPRIQMQSKSIDPANGGAIISSKDLQTGDIILSATNGLNSAGIRAITL